MQNRLETPEFSHWNSPLLNDLAFIKKHLRYPINKRTVWPLLWIISSFSIVILLGTIVFISSSASHRKIEFSINGLLPFFVIGLVFFVMGISIYRRMQSFRFISIACNFIVSDNIKLIRRFLEKQNIAYYHNPDAPEVFQISSRILDPQFAQREIMVFIADDNRILLNSHFTSQNGDRGMKEIATGAHKKMAADLRKWLKENDKDFAHQFSRKITGN